MSSHPESMQSQWTQSWTCKYCGKTFSVPTQHKCKHSTSYADRSPEFIG